MGIDVPNHKRIEMEFLVEKIGMSRTLAAISTPVTLLRVQEAKICEMIGENKALVAYPRGKTLNKSIGGQQKNTIFLKNTIALSHSRLRQAARAMSLSNRSPKQND